jgi:hypothetical protein
MLQLLARLLHSKLTNVIQKFTFIL